MHAAAAYGLPTIGVFKASDPIKSRPWGDFCGFLPAEVGAAAAVRALQDLMAAASPE